MDSHKLGHLLDKEEGFKLDFKAQLSLGLESEKKEFVKDVIAIANTPGGRGYIIFGIKDKTKEVLGIDKLPNNIEEKIQQIIAARSVPPVPVCFDLIPYKGKKIGVLTIFKSLQVPHQMLQTGAFYVRRGSTTDKATRHEIATLLQQFGMLSFENVPCRQADMDALDLENIEKYIGHFAANKNQIKALLVMLGILAQEPERDKYYPTYGGLLLFGKNPSYFIPQAVLEVTYEKKTVGIAGNISKMLQRFELLAQEKLPKSYPLEGLMEVITNAMVHRNYWNNTQYIRVELGEEKISISNPIANAQKYEAGGCIRVNPWLYSRLLLLQEDKEDFHFGIGLNKAKQLFMPVGDIQIYHHMEQGIFEVILPGSKFYQ